MLPWIGWLDAFRLGVVLFVGIPAIGLPLDLDPRECRKCGAHLK